MNLRGRVVTVVDLSRCLALPTSGEAASQVVLLDLGDPELSVGLLAERIDQVIDVEPPLPWEPERAEAAGGREGPEMLEMQGRVATVLDPARVLGVLLSGVGEGMGAGEGIQEGGRGRT
jgi:chemotaxis signal transduction protein